MKTIDVFLKGQINVDEWGEGRVDLWWLMAPSNGHAGPCVYYPLFRIIRRECAGRGRAAPAYIFLPRWKLMAEIVVHTGWLRPCSRGNRKLFVCPLPAADMRCEMRSSWPGAPKMMMVMTTTMMVLQRWAVLIGSLECQAFTIEAGGLCGESVYRPGGVLWSRLRTWIK